MSEYKATDAPEEFDDWEAVAWADGAEYGAAVERDRLLAVNAELVEALEVFADDGNWFDTYETIDPVPGWRGPDDRPEEFARAAIAKAEGTR